MSVSPKKKHPVVGIDLGTTYSAVAAFNHFSETSEILYNTLDGGREETVPSVVGLSSNGKVIVGEQARRVLVGDPDRAVIEIKREMGEFFRYTTPDVPGNVEKFRAEKEYQKLREAAGRRSENPAEIPFRAPFAGDWFLPQEISAFILMKMKQVAEADLGTEIRDAVITVPAYFTEKQKKATEEAALLAGLYPRQLLPEPTAAAICYGVDQGDSERRVYLVYDLGGGTFDVSIITVAGNDIDVVATSGDARLGGGDFDDLIVEWAVGQLRGQGIDVSDPLKKAVVKFYAEKLKRELSTRKEHSIRLPELNPEKPPRLDLKREDFEGLIDPLLQKSLTFVDDAIGQAQSRSEIGRDRIHGILLVGGSSKIPLVKTKLLDYFQKGEDFVRADLNPDEVVARGAAMIAAKKYGESPPPFDIERKTIGGMSLQTDEPLRVRFRTEHTLGVGVQDNLFCPIISQGTLLPAEEVKSDFTNAGPTRHVDVRVYQGEGEKVFENTYIGNLVLGPMEELAAYKHKFEVTFKLDENGLLAMEVHHVNESKRYHAKFEQKTGVQEKLADVRRKLLGMYDDQAGRDGATRVLYPSPETVASQDMRPPPPVPPSPTPTPTPTPGATSGGAADGASKAPAAEPAPGPSPTPTTEGPAAAGDGLLAPPATVAEKHESILRRARKQWLRRPDPDLLAAHNALVEAINTGKPDEVQDELHDELEDAYHDSRG